MSGNKRLSDWTTYVGRNSFPCSNTKEEDTFLAKGIYGKVYECKSPEDPTSRYIKKKSFHTDYTIRNEKAIMKALREMEVRKWNPHLICYCDETDDNDVIRMEHIKHSCTMFDYINKIEYTDENSVFSLILQVLVALRINVELLGLVHNDLHISNVMVGFCPRNYTFVYTFGDVTYRIPTYGVFPILIDYGMSVMHGQYLFASTAFTHIGQTLHIDPYSDARKFLCSVRYSLKGMKNPKAKAFVDYITTIYKGRCDINDGRITDDSISLEHFLVYHIQDQCTVNKSVLFENIGDSINILQSIIRLPLQDRGKEIVSVPYEEVSKQMLVLESQFLTESSKLDALRVVVDTVRLTRESYPEVDADVIKMFRNDLNARLTRKFPHFQIKDLNYTLLYSSILTLAEAIESVYFRIYTSQDLNDTHIRSKLRFFINVFKLKEDSQAEEVNFVLQ